MCCWLQLQHGLTEVMQGMVDALQGHYVSIIFQQNMSMLIAWFPKLTPCRQCPWSGKGLGVGDIPNFHPRHACIDSKLILYRWVSIPYISVIMARVSSTPAVTVISRNCYSRCNAAKASKRAMQGHHRTNWMPSSVEAGALRRDAPE
jgi:hypothetical protein